MFEGDSLNQSLASHIEYIRLTFFLICHLSKFINANIKINCCFI